jgi:asparagine synthase (glutamine-hydrolysing)
MCGILGIVTTENARQSDLTGRLRAMGYWQYHRGPDGWGEWFGEGVALGQNRLAILDLVHGKQPMSSADGRVQVVFNGEIYNFRQLWKELEQRGYRFKTDHSDTEVIVNGYAEWGGDVFERLEGMFAVAIWDQQEQRLILGRDRLGIKPLYYSSNGDEFVFASEPKTILAGSSADPRLNPSALPDFFMLRAPVGPPTLIDGMNKLSAGTWLSYDRREARVVEERYWMPRLPVTPLRDADVAEARVEETLEAAAVSHLVSDVPVGLFLSGGVDSSLLAAMVSRHARLDAFTVGTRSPLDESRFASVVARSLGIPLHVRWVTGDDFRERFADWSYFNDDPVADPSALALMLLAEHARERGMKVMLAGEGSDELFGGYYSYQRYEAYSLLSRSRVGRTARVLARWPFRRRDQDYLRSLHDLRFLGTSHVLYKQDRQALFTGETAAYVNEWEQDVFPKEMHGANLVRSAMLFDQNIRLPNDLLPRTDRATMAYSLEARVPYLDRELVELANTLDTRLCIRWLPPQSKWLLKRLAARNVPRDVIYRRKRGFNVPVEEWLATDFREQAETFLRDRVIDPLNYDYLDAMYRKHIRERHHGALLWAWLVLEQWHRLWLQGQARPPEPAVVSDREAYDLLASAARSQGQPRAVA